MKVLHVVVSYARYEGTGRWAAEIAGRLRSVDSLLLTNELRHGGDEFSAVTVVGGTGTSFMFTRRREIRALIEATRPDVVHLHGGPLTAFLAFLIPAGVPVVASMLAWPTVPPIRELLRGGVAQARASEALRARVFVTAALPTRAVRMALWRRGTRVLTPDPAVASRLGPRTFVRHAPGGAAVDGAAARYDPAMPKVVFAGRAENARGIDVLVDAFPRVVARHPTAVLRLCLLPGSDAPAIAEMVAASPVATRIDISFEPVADVRKEFADATVGAFPFKFAYTTSVPPLAVTEAMSVGLPTVVTSVRCMTPLVDDGENAAVVPTADTQATAAAICRLLENPDEWSRLAIGARATIAERWNWGTAAVATDETYSEVVHGNT